MDLKGKVAIVTGASRGIGESLAVRLSEKGVNLVLVARGLELLEKVRKNCEKNGVKAIVCQADMANMMSVENIVSRAKDCFDRIDILANNAGRSPKTNDPIEFELDDWDNTLDLNFRSIYYLTKLVLPEIQKQEEGAIINISSISATMTYKNGGIYCASKHALKAYSGCLFDNVRESGIKVCSILPGFVNTDMARSEGLDEELMIQPNDIADAMTFVLESSKSVCPTEIKLRPQRSPYR